MKPARFLSVMLLLLGSAPVFSAVKNVVVIDFTDMPRNQDGSRVRGYEYSFGDWEGNKKVTQIPGKGLLINLLGSSGGVGENRGLDFRKHTLARISLIIGNRNQADSFSFSLVDNDGTDQSWDVTLKNQNKGVGLSLLVDLSQPSRENKPGTTPGLALKKLKTWQIRGNYQSAPIEVMISEIKAVSE